MSSIRSAAVCLLLAGSPAVPGPAALAADAPPGLLHERLGNGMEVVIIPDRRAPVVTHMVWYKVGGADDEPGRSGLAHFLEHLMFKGTASVPAGVFSGLVASRGGAENAFTSPDATAYYQRVTPDLLGEMMRLEADRMTGLVLTDEAVVPERDVVLEERRARVDSSPGSMLSEAMAAALYVNHPYGTPVIGWESEIAGLDREAALAFYRRHYRPDNAVLVVVGDVEPQAALALAQSTYGALARPAPVPPSVRPQEPEPQAARRVELADPRVSVPSWRRDYLVPSYPRAQGREAAALDILATILGSQRTGRLQKALAREAPIVASVGAGYTGGSRDLGEFNLAASPLPGTPLGELEARIDSVLDTLLKDGVTQEELDRARTALVKSTLFERDSQSALAELYGATLAVGGRLEDVAEWPERLAAVTVEDVNAAARRWLVPARSVTGTLVPVLSATRASPMPAPAGTRTLEPAPAATPPLEPAPSVNPALKPVE